MTDEPVAQGDVPFVLHVSGDFPDTFVAQKTPVIRTLIELTKDHFEHFVVSINRQSLSPIGPLADPLRSGTKVGRITEVQAFDHGTALRYAAPGRGLFHRSALENVGDWLVDYIADLPRKPSLLVGHKLTIEGIIVSYAAEKLQLPYALSIQGNTDTKILQYRPDLRPVFSRVFHNAQCVFPFAPWALKGTEAKLGKARADVRMLPCPTVLDDPIAPKLTDGNLISVFHLRNHRIKNLDRMSRALKRVLRESPNIRLDIIGGGSDEDVAACKRAISDNPAISLAGHRDPVDLQPIMNQAAALVMPSRRESFGLVFIEALFAGSPIIYPRGASVDGYFEGLPFAIGVDPTNVSEIASAIKLAATREEELKLALADWQSQGGLDPFTRKAIAATFTAGLNRAMR